MPAIPENQPPLLEEYNVFGSDRALVDAVAREAPGAQLDELSELGELAGRSETIALGFEANEHPPELRTHDRFGSRIDEVRFHPAWHALLRRATAAGLGGTPWEDRARYPHVRRAREILRLGASRIGSWMPRVDDVRVGPRGQRAAGTRRAVARAPH